MANQLSDRLRRLGVKKGARSLKPGPPLRSDPDNKFRQNTEGRPADASTISNRDIGPAESVESLFPEGQIVEIESGSCFTIETTYSLDALHGRWRLGDLFSLDSSPLGHIFEAASPENTDLRNTLFLDTETTGLYGAAVFPFLVGVGFFRDEEFVVRQIFAREHGEECAALELALGIVNEKNQLVTFNGHAFDLPLLDTRFRLNRLEPSMGRLVDRPGYDLFKIGRRLWRWAAPSCSLIGLEKSVMAIERHEPDIPGHQIPWVYRTYIEQQDARPLSPIFSHNRMDILSMVTLLSEILLRFSDGDASFKPLEHYGLARFWMFKKEYDRAEAALRIAADISPGDVLDGGQRLILRELARLLKRQNRRGEASSFWEILATKGRDVDACVELAKWYEWEKKDCAAALEWTRKALELPVDSVQAQELSHRKKRLLKKI